MKRNERNNEQEESAQQQVRPQAIQEADESVPYNRGTYRRHSSSQPEEHERRGLHEEGRDRTGQERCEGNDQDHRLNLNA